MAKKRYVRKKKKGRRTGCLLWMALLGLAVGLVVLLILRAAADPAETARQGGDGLWDGSYYADSLGRIESDKALVKGMSAYEEKTGVKPFLALLDGIGPQELRDFAEEQYEALFSGGDHLLVVYDEWGDGQYFLCGRTGQGSALAEAQVTELLSCLEAAYADPDNGSYAEAFGAGFQAAARKIDAAKGSTGPTGLLIAAGIMLLVCAALFLMLRRQALESRQEG